MQDQLNCATAKTLRASSTIIAALPLLRRIRHPPIWRSAPLEYFFDKGLTVFEMVYSLFVVAPSQLGMQNLHFCSSDHPLACNLLPTLQRQIIYTKDQVVKEVTHNTNSLCPHTSIRSGPCKLVHTRFPAASRSKSFTRGMYLLTERSKEPASLLAAILKNISG